MVYKDTGNPSTSPVLFYLDSGPSVGLPFVTNGGALTVPWNDGGFREEDQQRLVCPATAWR